MDRFEITKRVGILGIVGNIFLLVIKAIMGILFKSQAMIADAANSASDIFASIMTTVGNMIASEPSDEDHNFGHGKAEYIFSLFISLSMIVLSAKILYDCVLSILKAQTFEFSWILIAVCIITIITKLLLYFYAKRALKIHKNILIESSMKDHRNDCIITLFTTLSIIFSTFNIYLIDGIVGIGISMWIFYTGIKIFVESFNVLMDKSIDENTKEEICKSIEKYKEIQGLKSIYTIPTGYKYIAVLTIYLDGSLDTFKSHEIADKLQEDIEKRFDAVDKVIVHVEPQERKVEISE